MFKIRNMLNFKVLGLMLLFLMILGVASSLPIYASEPSDGYQTENIMGSLNEYDSSELIVEDDVFITIPEEFSEIPMGGIGMAPEESLDNLTKGPMPHFTSASVYKWGWLSNGNWGVKIKITGYGRPLKTNFNTKVPKLIKEEMTVNDWTNLFTGYYYTYDCGPIRTAGDYTFKSTIVGQITGKKLTIRRVFIFN